MHQFSQCIAIGILLIFTQQVHASQAQTFVKSHAELMIILEEQFRSCKELFCKYYPDFAELIKSPYEIKVNTQNSAEGIDKLAQLITLSQGTPHLVIHFNIDLDDKFVMIPHPSVTKWLAHDPLGNLAQFLAQLQDYNLVGCVTSNTSFPRYTIYINVDGEWRILLPENHELFQIKSWTFDTLKGKGLIKNRDDARLNTTESLFCHLQLCQKVPVMLFYERCSEPLVEVTIQVKKSGKDETVSQ